MAAPESLARQALALTDESDWPAREALFTEDCEFVTPFGALRGPAATTAFSEPMMHAFPNGHHRIDVIIARGDVAVVEGVWVATHTGPLATPNGEVPATGRTVELPFMATLRAEGDRIGSIRVYFDQLGFLGQLGLVPEPSAA
jgi:predicted ester cyclase